MRPVKITKMSAIAKIIRAVNSCKTMSQYVVWSKWVENFDLGDMRQTVFDEAIHVVLRLPPGPLSAREIQNPVRLK